MGSACWSAVADQEAVRNQFLPEGDRLIAVHAEDQARINHYGAVCREHRSGSPSTKTPRQLAAQTRFGTQAQKIPATPTLHSLTAIAELIMA